MVTSMVSLPDLLDAMADLDVEVVATLDESQRDGLPPLPDNVRLVDFVPLQALLPTCAAIVHHGGVGTWFTAATYGVPQIIVATSWDTPIRAGRTEDQDAGLAVSAADLTPELLRDKVVRVIEGPRFTAGATRLRDELLAAPPPAEIVPELVRLTERHRGEHRSA
jgi:UDP:flavonoid glycosyltransferase YjiC (YdhE family)